MDNKIIKKLKIIRNIFIIFFIGSVALLIGSILISNPKSMLVVYSATLTGLFIWANGERREIIIRILFFAVLIPLIIGMFDYGDSKLSNLAQIIVQVINAILFLMISMKKINNIPKIKRFVLLMSVILIIFQIAITFSNAMQLVELEYATLPSGFTIFILGLSVFGGILISFYVLFYTYIVVSCLDPIFYKKFVKQKPGIAICKARTVNNP